MTYRQTWDLATLLEGAGSSKEKIDAKLKKLEVRIQEFSWDGEDLFERYTQLSQELEEAGSLIGCLTAENAGDLEAAKLEAKCQSVEALMDSLDLTLDQKLSDLSEEEFKELIRKHREIAFILELRRKDVKERMPLSQEQLVSDLSVAGHYSFTTLYYTLMGGLSFPFDGASLNLSKLENNFDNHERKKRLEAYESLEKVLGKEELIFAHILNNIIGFRLTLYENRGWDDFLYESLSDNRMSKKTLLAMWGAVANNKAMCRKFLERKAKILGLPRLSYADVGAPIGDANEAHISWDEGCQTILKAFANISPDLASFSKKALEEGWVDAKPSRTKRAGGFCTSLPLSKASRIFMTYMNNAHSKMTLAHELGHAYHSHVLYDRPPMLQDYPMNVAETASIICETIVSEDALRNATSTKEKIALLDEKIGRSIAFQMDLHSRFLFDVRFHEERQNDFVSPDRINHLMVEAQREGFGGALSDYVPHFWAYKMHFFFTDTPFYNWPYTFGYLFSLGLYKHLQELGDFEKRYIAFLKDTGSMQIEELAQKHLKVDLTTPVFWESALALVNKDIEEFLILTK